MLVPVRVKRALLIVNPYSTQVTGPSITAVENALREHVEIETSFTQHPGHATELAAAAAADSVDAIVVFSGDGTYNEALNGADGALPIGFLPGGGTSVLPRALGLSRDPAEAARAVGAALAEGRLRRITLGTVNGRRFSFSAGIGFDAEAVRRLNRLGRDPAGARPGDLAFARMLARMIVRAARPMEPGARDRGRRPCRVLARRELRPVFVRRVGAAARHAGRAVRGRPRVRGTRARTPARHAAARRGDHGRAVRTGKNVLTGLDLDRIEVRCDRPLPLQADGEDLGDVEHAVFEAHRDAVAVLV